MHVQQCMFVMVPFLDFIWYKLWFALYTNPYTVQYQAMICVGWVYSPIFGGNLDRIVYYYYCMWWGGGDFNSFFKKSDLLFILLLLVLFFYNSL